MLVGRDGRVSTATFRGRRWVAVRIAELRPARVALVEKIAHKRPSAVGAHARGCGHAERTVALGFRATPSAFGRGEVAERGVQTLLRGGQFANAPGPAPARGIEPGGLTGEHAWHAGLHSTDCTGVVDGAVGPTIQNATECRMRSGSSSSHFGAAGLLAVAGLGAGGCVPVGSDGCWAVAGWGAGGGRDRRWCLRVEGGLTA